MAPDVNLRTHLKVTGSPRWPAHICVAVDGSGNVVTSSNPTGGAPAWTVSHVHGMLAVQLGLGDFVMPRLSCPSSRLCVAMDGIGNVVTSSNPTGGAAAWTLTNTDVDAFNYLSGVSCPSVSICVAVDRSGNVVTGTQVAITTTTAG